MYPHSVYSGILNSINPCRLWFGSCGASQWRLDGPGAWPGAEHEMCKTPVTSLMQWSLLAILALGLLFLGWCLLWFIILDDIMDWDIID